MSCRSRWTFAELYAFSPLPPGEGPGVRVLGVIARSDWVQLCEQAEHPHPQPLSRGEPKARRQAQSRVAQAHLIDMQMSLPRRLWNAIASAARQRPAHGAGEIDQISRRHVKRLRLVLGANDLTDQLVLVVQR